MGVIKFTPDTASLISACELLDLKSEPYLKATVEKTQLLEGACEPSEGFNGSEIGAGAAAGATTTVTGLGPGVVMPVEACERSAVLSYEQVRRLHDVMEEVVGIHGRGNFPTLQVKLRELVAGVRAAVLGAGVSVRGVRLNGGAASHVIAATPQPYSDIDLIFSVDLPTPRHADRLRTATLNHLATLLPAPLNAHPQHASRRKPSACTLKEAYVSKMVKVNSEGDRWSLISLGNSRGHKSVELKFVDTMRRQFEFSVDSFQIALDSLLEFHDCAQLPIGENFYPTVVGESVYGDFHEALYHLCEKLIATRQPEEIRGGGLLKYCALLAKGYRPAEAEKIKTLERYMCSRFFIDFPDLNQQRAKLEAYLRNHFVGREEESLKYRYLTLLHSVVRESTVCLMGHERRQTLALIEMVATRELCAERARHHHQVAVQQAAAHQVAAQQVAAHQVTAHQVAGSQVGAQHQQQAVIVPGYYVACWCGPCCAPCCCAECWGCPA